MLSCLLYKKYILSYADGELYDKRKKTRVEKHLKKCSECRELYEYFLKTRPTAPENPLENIPAASWYEHQCSIMRRIRQISAEPEEKKIRWFRIDMAIYSTLMVVMVFSIFAALGPQLKNMFEKTVDSESVGRGQAAISSAIY